MNPLHCQLEALGLRGMAEQIDDALGLGTKKRWSSTQLLEHLIRIEQQDRSRRSLERRMARSKLGTFKPMDDFDWNWPTKIDRPTVEACLNLEFIDGANNVVLVAPHGLGKTMIAQNIAHQAILSGHSVLFTDASSLLLDLTGTESARGLDRRLKHYAGFGILCVDEIGYLTYDDRNADLLYQLVSRRYERKSTILTTNLAFQDWPTIFPNATCATALIDRIVHHAEIIAIEGESYRRRDAEEAKATRTKRRSTKKPQRAK